MIASLGRVGGMGTVMVREWAVRFIVDRSLRLLEEVGIHRRVTTVNWFEEFPSVIARISLPMAKNASRC